MVKSPPLAIKWLAFVYTLHLCPLVTGQISADQGECQAETELERG